MVEACFWMREQQICRAVMPPEDFVDEETAVK
jgi:hypothetical protein